MWKFAPILKPTIWGGERIIPFKRLAPSLSHVGESWEVSGVPDCESVVEGGPDDGLRISELIEKYGSEMLGERNYKRFGSQFPLLIKFIDTADKLSVQVHPDDELAQSRGYSNGKNEMWYVIKANKGARIANGFKKETCREEFLQLVEDGKADKALNYVDIKPSDVFYIPAGRVHAIGKGVLLVEIQQTSDLTYRIFDYNRRDSEGNLRDLHLDLALDAISYTDTCADSIPYVCRPGIPVNLVNSPYFKVNLHSTETELIRDYSEIDTFTILTATEGEADITCGNDTIRLRRGNSILVPASANGITISPHKAVTLLETLIV